MGLVFTKKQKEAWNLLGSGRYTRYLFDGGSRSGKTSLIAEYLIRRALRYPESCQLAARKYKVHAKTSLWNNTLKSYLSENLPRSRYHLSESDLTIHFSNGSRIMTAGLDDAERTEKILGNEFITLFLNEATQFSYETLQMALTRLAQKCSDRNGHQAIPKLILDCNPRGPRHWLHYVGVRHADPESGKPLADAAKWARVSWSAYDNLENLPAEYIASLEALPEVMRERMLNGVWRENSGAVYQEFDEDIHTVAPFEIPSSWKRYRAIDFGFTNPFVCLWGAEDHDGRLYIYRMLYKAAERIGVHGEKIKKLSGNEHYLFTVADHDAGERAELESSGIHTIPAYKNVICGIQTVKKRLALQADGKPRLFFFSDLKELLSEIYEYRWLQPDGRVNACEEPLKLNDHAMDALRYMIVALEKQTGSSFRSANCAVPEKTYTL